jgi:hypothetical protein
MPESTKAAWNKFYANGVNFGSEKGYAEKNEKRKFCNWTKVPEKIEVFYQGGFDAKRGFDGRGILIFPKQCILVAR